MKVLFDNVSFSSPSGPNAFALKLAKQLAMMGHTIADPHDCDVQLSFITTTQRRASTILRLDGVWFNTAQDYRQMNEPILQSMLAAEAVIVQTEFDRELVARYLGPHPNVTVIRNGTDVEGILATEPLQSAQLDTHSEVWCCASSWRPHKRLSEDVRYFREHAPTDACLVVAGENPDSQVADPRVFYAGHMDQQTLWGLYRMVAETGGSFVHLPWLGHCDNVLIDARAAGCRVVCTDSGGTKEIAGKGAAVVRDAPWDWQPLELYEPPQLDLSQTYLAGEEAESELDIAVCAKRYLAVLESVA